MQQHNGVQINGDIVLADFLELTPEMLVIWSKVVAYCKKNDLRLCISSLINDRKGALLRDPHKSGRGIDISIIFWTDTEIADFLLYFNTLFLHLGAVGRDTGKRSIALRHWGTADHIHLQVHRG